MFFKSRVERDIDHFKAMQEKGAQLTKRADQPDQPDVSTDNRSADQSAARLDDQTLATDLREPAAEVGERQQSMVGANDIWEGKIFTVGSARIEGEVSGEVEAGETVFIERGARVRASIHARQVVIGGEMEGQIVCQEKLVVESSGRLGGEVSTRTLVIEEGAVVHSHIRMLDDEEPAPAAADSGNAALSEDSAVLSAIEAELGLKAWQASVPEAEIVERDREEEVC